MAAPSSLSGLSSAVTIDGTDLHEYGMVIDRVSNPVPRARRSVQTIFNRDGDFDYTRNYEPRIMSISGSIIGNSNTDLYSRIDSLKSFFRLRENGDSFKVVFQNQTDRYWTCKYDGNFQVNVALWKINRTAKFSLQLKCTKLYSEATSKTSISMLHDIFQNKEITYLGNYLTPIDLSMRSIMRSNLLDEAADGDVSNDNTEWSYDNATGSNVADNAIYGAYAVRASRTDPGAYYAQVDVTAVIDTEKYYVFAAFVTATEGGTKTPTTLNIINDGSGGDLVAGFNDAGGDQKFTFKKISADQLAGASSVIFRVANDGTDDWIDIDGCFIYEITEDDFDNDDYYPPPYTSDPNDDFIVETNDPKMRIIHNSNLMNDGHGDSVDNWTSDPNDPEVVYDPYDMDQKALLFFNPVGEVTNKYYSPFITISPKETFYQVRYRYLVTKVPSVAPESSVIAFYGTDETDTALVRGDIIDDSDIEITELTGGWVSVTGKIIPKNHMQKIAMYIAIEPGITLFVKNLQVVEVASYEASYVDYIKHESNSIAWESKLEDDDSIFINSEKIVAQHFDASLESVVNGISDFVGEKGIYLYPGTNILKFTDSRDGKSRAQFPEVSSAGSVDLIATYRERYL